MRVFAFTQRTGLCRKDQTISMTTWKIYLPSPPPPMHMTTTSYIRTPQSSKVNILNKYYQAFFLFFISHKRNLQNIVLESNKYTLLLLDIPYQRSFIFPCYFKEQTRLYFIFSKFFWHNIVLTYLYYPSFFPLPSISNSSYYQKGDSFVKMKFFLYYLM